MNNMQDEWDKEIEKMNNKIMSYLITIAISMATTIIMLKIFGVL